MLDADKESRLRKDCVEFAAAHRDYSRLQVGISHLIASTNSARVALTRAEARERGAEIEINYALEDLEDEDSERVKAIIKEYTSDLIETPRADEVLQISWLGDIDPEELLASEAER
jgi:hypothetical protein